MKLIIDETRNETRRQTGNQPWPPTGLISSRIVSRALELKGLIQRDMAPRTIEEANRICDTIIKLTEQVEVLENAPLTGGYNG